MYFIYGDESYLIEKKVQEIIKQNNLAKVISFNNDIKLGEIINQISSFSLFDSSRLLIFRDLSYFQINKNEEAEALIKSLRFKPSSTTIIFTSSKINEKSPTIFTKYLLENVQTFKFDNLSDKEILNITKQEIIKHGATISDVDLFYFLSKIPNSLTIIINEIEKLVVLDKNISRTNIDESIQKYSVGSAFDFINSFNSGNTEMLFKSYYEKISHGETIQNLIGQITNVLELCSRIYSLKQSKHTDKEIEQILGKHSFVIKKNLEFLNFIGYKKICNYLNMISEIDTKIKSGLLDEKIGFERFLLETTKNN